MSGTTILSEIIEIMTGAITGIAEGVGTGLSTLAQNIFLTSAGALSVFGTFVVIFSAISLGIGLCRLLVRWLSTLGGSRV